MTSTHRLPHSMHRPPAKSDLERLHETFCWMVNLGRVLSCRLDRFETVSPDEPNSMGLTPSPLAKGWLLPTRKTVAYETVLPGMNASGSLGLPPRVYDNRAGIHPPTCFGRPVFKLRDLGGCRSSTPGRRSGPGVQVLAAAAEYLQLILYPCRWIRL